MTRNLELEATIVATPDDPAPYLVYADWLTAQGDPRGELIVLQHELSRQESADKRVREKELAIDMFAGPLDEDLATVSWRWGFVDGVRLFNYRDWMDSSFEVLPLLDRILDAPAAALVRELRLGVLRWMENGEDVPAVLAAVAKRGLADRIELLHLGDVADIDCDLGHHPLGDLAVINQSFKNLVSLTLHGCDFKLGSALDLPRLRTLTIETCGLDQDDVRAIAAARWPALEEMTLWFGSEDYGSSATAADLAPLLAGDKLPRLKRLGLCNSEFVGDICQMLAGSPLLTQLEVLDLSMGTLDDSEAQALVSMGAELVHLERLDVSESFLTADGIAALETIGCPIVAEDQKELEEGDEDWRYVSMAE